MKHKACKECGCDGDWHATHWIKCPNHPKSKMKKPEEENPDECCCTACGEGYGRCVTEERNKAIFQSDKYWEQVVNNIVEQTRIAIEHRDKKLSVENIEKVIGKRLAICKEHVVRQDEKIMITFEVEEKAKKLIAEAINKLTMEE